MEKVNLDINTYSLIELQNLLKLINPYNEYDILNKKNALENQISKSNINQNKKEELYIFLDNIKNKLISEYLNSTIQSELLSNDTNKYNGNHFATKNNDEQYTSVLENNKKINKSIIKKTYTIDSIFRSNYNNIDNQSHDYIIDLPETITNALTMSISSIEIPLTYHNISDDLNNNTFKIEVINKNPTPPLVEFSCNIVLLSGLYESLFTSLQQKKAQNIQDQINRQITTQANSDISNNLSFSIDPISGFSSFIFNTNSNSDFLTNKEIVIDFNINNNKSLENCNKNLLHQKLGWQLGFRTDRIIIDSTNTQNISPCICHIAYPRYLYIAIDDFQTSSHNHFAIASSSIIASNIIARINILSCLEDKTAYKNAANPGDYLYSNKHIREYFGPTNIKKLKIQLLDEYGRHFSINNMDWSFVASFECFYN